MMRNTLRVKVKRRDTPTGNPYWQGFEVPYKPTMNVISVLQEIRKNPVTVEGQRVAPVVWDCNCLEEVCGACSMLINGHPRQACSALVGNLSWPIFLEPFTKFPVVRDLLIDRGRMFESLKRVKAWIPLDGTHAMGPGPNVSPQVQQVAYDLSRCMTCGCCLEACPQVNAKTHFVGAAILSQVRYFNMHPTGQAQAGERLEGLMQEGGIQDCGNAQNCVRVCPKDIPLTTSIAEVNHEVTRYVIKKLFRG